jgi:hypothetical protein
VPLNLPGLLVDVVGSNCSLPGAAGGALSCAVEVHNSGNVRLQGGSVSGTGAATASECAFNLLPPGGKFICQVQQEVSQLDFDSADADSAYTVSIGVSGVATPLGSNSSDVTSGGAEAVALAPALRHNMIIEGAAASPTTVVKSGKVLPTL